MRSRTECCSFMNLAKCIVHARNAHCTCAIARNNTKKLLNQSLRMCKDVDMLDNIMLFAQYYQ